MKTIIQLQVATNTARANTGDKHISTHVGNGLVDVVRAVPPISGRGAYTITVLRSGLTPAQAVAHLEAMK